MSDLSEYLSQEQQITDLKKKLASVSRDRRKWKNKYFELSDEIKPISRTQRAILLIKSGEDLTAKQIGKACHISPDYVASLRSEVKKGLHD